MGRHVTVAGLKYFTVLNSKMRINVIHGAEEVGEIPRINVADITPEEFEAKYVNRCLPVILTGVMDDWPAFKADSPRKWTLDFFKNKYGSIKCPIDISGCKQIMTMAEYLEQFEEFSKLPPGTSIPYLRTWYFSDDIPELVDDFVPPELFHKFDAFMRLPVDLKPPFRWLFFGPRGTESKLHVDIWETDAWLGMLQGTKTFTLYHPAHRRFIERGDNEWADLLQPVDKDKFPEQHSAFPVQADVHAGEVIYIPRKWPHHAVAQTDSISLTLNFATKTTKDNIVRFLEPYIRNRGRCQALLGRVLKAQDNLMQLCIHGGTIKYGDLNVQEPEDSNSVSSEEDET